MMTGGGGCNSGRALPLSNHGRLLLSMAAAAGLHAWLLYGASPSGMAPAPPQRSHQVTRVVLPHPAQQSAATPPQQSLQGELPPHPHNEIASQGSNELEKIEAHEARAPDSLQPASAYIDEKLLATKPSVSGEVLIPFPPEAPEGVFKATLTLYIDQHGTVQQVEVVENSIPEPLANAAITAFRAAKFAPGELNGVPVKSTLSIEIVFDSADVAAPSNERLLTTN